MDDADRAQIAEAVFLQRAIDAARGIRPPDQVSTSECVECGAPIPDARRRAIPGVTTCRDCATALEQRRLRGLV